MGLKALSVERERGEARGGSSVEPFSFSRSGGDPLGRGRPGHPYFTPENNNALVQRLDGGVGEKIQAVEELVGVLRRPARLGGVEDRAGLGVHEAEVEEDAAAEAGEATDEDDLGPGRGSPACGLF